MALFGSQQSSIDIDPKAPSQSVRNARAGLPSHGGYVCYLCGDQFGSKTLQMHVNACQRKWHDDQMKLAPERRKPLPPMPKEVAEAEGLPAVTVEVQAFNSRMMDYYSQHTASKSCQDCGEEVSAARLSHHQRSCPAKSNAGCYEALMRQHEDAMATASMRSSDASGREEVPRAGSVSNPRASYTCFLCGQSFGTRSLGIHLPQCYKKWELTDALLPIEEQRTHPHIPQELAEPGRPGHLRGFKDGAAEGVLPTSAKEINAFNRAMAELARKNGQSQPSARNILPAAVQHTAPPQYTTPSSAEPICSDGKKDGALTRLAKFAFGGGMPYFAKRPSLETGTDSPAPVEAIAAPSESSSKAYTCYLCGRQYGARSLGIHMHHCYRQRELQNLKLPHPRPSLPLPPRELADRNNPVRLCTYQDGSIPEGVLPDSAAGIKNFNAAMTDYWRAGLPKCMHCRAVFLPEKLLDHQGSCTAAHSTASSEAKSHQAHGLSTATKPQQKPSGRAVPMKSQQHTRPAPKTSKLAHAQAILRVGGFRHYRCYLCEEKFPGSALKAHCMECKRAWVKAEGVLPEGMRRLLPPPPAEMRLILTGQAELPVDPSDVAAFNAAMAAHWEGTSLLRCHSCKGSFRPSVYAAEHENNKCSLLTGGSDDTTVSLGDAAPEVLTPPITRAVARPTTVPSLALGTTNPRPKQRAAITADPSKPYTQQADLQKLYQTQKKQQLLAQQQQQYQQRQLLLQQQKESEAVRSTLMQAAAALAQNSGYSKRSSSKAPPSSAKAAPAPAPKKSAVKAPAKLLAPAPIKKQPAPGRPGAAPGKPTGRAVPLSEKAKTMAQKAKGRATSSSRPEAKLSAGSRGGSALSGRGSRPETPAAGQSKAKRPATPKATENCTHAHCYHDHHHAGGLKTGESVSSAGADSENLALHSGGTSHMYACYLCSQHYHYASYHMHIGQCIRKWERVQLAIEPPEQRAPVPPAPPGLNLDGPLPMEPHAVAAFNKTMREHREKFAMRECRKCSKSVSLLQWARHKQQCTGSTAASGHTSSMASSDRKAAASSRGRLAYMCYVCADSFNANKYHSHVDTCRKRFEKEDLANRRNLPEGFQKPCALPTPVSDHRRLPVDIQHIETFNDRMAEIHENLQMSLKMSLPPKGMMAQQRSPSMSPPPKRMDHDIDGFMDTGLSDDALMFTPLPTGPGMKKGEVMISCRHCGKAVTEDELFTHIPLCAPAADGITRVSSVPHSSRSYRSNSHRTHRALPDEPVYVLRTGRNNTISRRATNEDVPSISPHVGAGMGSQQTTLSTGLVASTPTVPEVDESSFKPKQKKSVFGKARSKIKKSFKAFGHKLTGKGKQKAEQQGAGSAVVTVTAM